MPLGEQLVAWTAATAMAGPDGVQAPGFSMAVWGGNQWMESLSACLFPKLQAELTWFQVQDF